MLVDVVSFMPLYFSHRFHRVFPACSAKDLKCHPISSLETARQVSGRNIFSSLSKYTFFPHAASLESGSVTRHKHLQTALSPRTSDPVPHCYTPSQEQKRSNRNIISSGFFFLLLLSPSTFFHSSLHSHLFIYFFH